MTMKILSHSPKVIEYSINNLPEVARLLMLHIENNKIKVLGFQGGLGAGKTTLIKEIIKELGVCDLVKSPTYSIQMDYNGYWGEVPILVSHWDLYRISEGEAIQMYNEYLSEKSNLEQVLLIEWAERLGSYCNHFIQVEISDLDDGSHRSDEKSPKDIHERRIIQLICPEIDK